LAAENARRLLDSSLKLGEAGNFGLACSLAVLAGEESIKSLALMAWSSDFPIPSEKQLALVLRHHEPRHLAAGMLAGAGEMFVAMIGGIIATITKKAGDSTVDQKDQWSRARWWAEADALKNRGLYVEFTGKKWKGPGDVTQAEFERAYEMANDFVGWVVSIVDEEDPEKRRGLVVEGPSAG
jgi:AbiV family abortive infection protein